ncbi:dTDP-4-dehydrorhamnose reductase [Pseudooctadecabacter sp.]|uniref:dTDP-4-dehydrorhamnose reductase n=1 Tax=Pseudooctadecabacter sp. TaxID=1966338 RepID=UPI003F6C2210
MHVLVFGQTGQVAQALQTCAASRTGVTITALSRAQADLSDPDACAEVINAIRPDAVINAAAYTGVDAAEADAARAEAINAAAPGAMARTCATHDIPFVTLSTDYVFDGTGSAPWTPEAHPNPANVYGRTKRMGETAVQQAGGRWAIVRTSWVFSEHGRNFVKTMHRLAQTHASVRVVDDQVGGPTYAGDIAGACLTIATALADDPSKSGIYHYSGSPDISWAGFARTIFDQANLTCTVDPIPTSDYPTPAARPLNSRLECSKTTAIFGIERPAWRRALTGVLTELEKPRI